MTSYQYHPYMVTMHELSMAQMLSQLLVRKMPMTAEDYQYQRSLYIESNYQVTDSGHSPDVMNAYSLDFGMRNSVECSVVRSGR